MRITHVIFSNGFAGSERGTVEMCNAQADRHEVTLIVGRGHRRASGASILDAVGSGVRVIKLPHAFRSFWLRRALARARPEIIHTHLSRTTRRVCDLEPTAPTIVTLHNGFKGSLARTDGLICIGREQRKEVPSSYAGRIWYLPNGTLSARRLSEEERTACRRIAGAGPGDFLIGGVGRLTRSKGFDTLLRAFERADLPGARLAIVGEGDERGALEARAGDRVRFLGFRPDVRDFYQAFDLFVCPSRAEPFGRVIIEAFDAGAPVIATAVDEPAHIVPEIGGELVPVDDSVAMAAAIRRHHDGRTPRRSYDLEKYRLPAVVAAVETMYRELIEQRG